MCLHSVFITQRESIDDTETKVYSRIHDKIWPQKFVDTTMPSETFWQQNIIYIQSSKYQFKLSHSNWLSICIKIYQKSQIPFSNDFIKKVFTFYMIQIFVNVFTGACHWTPSWTTLSPMPVSSKWFLQVYWLKMLMQCSSCPSSTHLTLPDFTALIILMKITNYEIHQ